MEKRRFEWVAELSSGDGVIDTHIKEFLVKSNEFINSKDSDYRVESLDKLLSFLLDYCRKHFPVQEEMMKRINYPSVKEHQSDHKFFLRRISKIYKQLLVQKDPQAQTDDDYDERGVDGVISDAYDAIINWHDNHLMGADRRLTDYHTFEWRS